MYKLEFLNLVLWYNFKPNKANFQFPDCSLSILNTLFNNLPYLKLINKVWMTGMLIGDALMRMTALTVFIMLSPNNIF